MTELHIQKIEEIINMYFKNYKVIKLLDAGCGSVNNLSFRKKIHIVGIDISEHQLERSSHLDEKILGDLEKYRFKENDFDLIVCWDVLEHLNNPIAALDNFKEAVKKDGLILLKLPNLFSLKGIITKLTPYAFHRFIYKNVFKSRLVERQDGGPFKTFLRWSISKNSLLKYARKNSLEVFYQDTYDFGDIWNPLGKGLKQKLYIFSRNLLKVLSFGKIDKSELVLIIRK